MKQVKIVNREIFNEKIMQLGSVTEVANKIGTVPSTVSKWLNNKSIYIKSEYLEKILEEYNLKPDDIGATEIDTDNNPTISARIKELREENNITQSEFAKEMGVSTSIVSKWENGISTPTTLNLEGISYYFGVSISYLLCVTNLRDPDNEEIANILNCEEYLLDFIKDDNENATRNFLGNEYTAKEIGEKFFDLKDIVYSDVALLSTLKDECDRIICYYTSNDYYCKYEAVMNETDILSQTIGHMQRFNIEKVVGANISEALKEAFMKYVDIKLTEIYKNDPRFKDKYSSNKDDIEVTKMIKQNIARYF